MSSLSTDEKLKIGIVTVVLVICGIVTLRAQMNYCSPLVAFNEALPGQTKTEAGSNGKVTIAIVKENLNLRPAQNTNNTPLKVLKAGTKVRVISINKGWAKIIDDTGTEGYVGNTYLRY